MNERNLVWNDDLKVRLIKVRRATCLHDLTGWGSSRVRLHHATLLTQTRMPCCAQRIASDELGISEEEMDWRLQQLTNLLPGLEARLIRVRWGAVLAAPVRGACHSMLPRAGALTCEDQQSTAASGIGCMESMCMSQHASQQQPHAVLLMRVK